MIISTLIIKYIFLSFPQHIHLSSTTQILLKTRVLKTQKRASYTLEAIAEDRGSNPLSRTVEVQVEVVDRSNKPPVWDDLDRISRAVYVKENTAVGETVTTVRARSEIFQK